MKIRERICEPTSDGGIKVYEGRSGGPTGLISVRREESRWNRNRADALVHLKASCDGSGEGDHVSGDDAKAAVAEAYRAHYRRLVAAAYSVSGDYDDVQDIVQEGVRPSVGPPATGSRRG
jgi:hypothetical protein